VSGLANSFTLVVAEECVDLLNKGIRAFVVGSEGQLAEIPIEGETPTTVATIDRTLAGLAELIGNLQRAGENGQGPAGLGALRERGVAVPEPLVRDGRLATLWGDVVLTRDGQNWVVDLYAAPKDVCKALYLGANTISGVVRVAASASARDETNIPVTAEQADLACSNTESDIVRIIAAKARAPVDRSPLPVPTDQLLAQLAEFIGGLGNAPASADGRMTLPALRQLGVAVPGGFVRDGELAWPWGETTITRSGREWVLDLHSAPKELCKAIQLGANGIPVIGRIATSYQAKDEEVMPVTAERAETACSNRESGVIRIITRDTSISRLALDKLAAAWRRLKRTLGEN
jgi:hypothetical protein